jgi:hypothetical protein
VGIRLQVWREDQRGVRLARSGSQRQRLPPMSAYTYRIGAKTAIK